MSNPFMLGLRTSMLVVLCKPVRNLLVIYEVCTKENGNLELK